MSDVHRASMLNRFTVVSTFSGGGGSSIGYKLAGGRVALVNEFVPEAARTYARNFPGVAVDGRDIRAILERQHGVESFLAQAGLEPGGFDILDGSPPCCEFSVAGPGFSDPEVMRRYSDVKQRDIASLPFDFVEMARRARPKVVIIENVPGLAYRRSRDVLEALLHPLGLPEDGYFVGHRVLSASDFGVAQDRRRLFILGVRKDIARAHGITSNEQIERMFPESDQLSPITIRAAFEGLQQAREHVEPWHRAARTSGLSRLINLLPTRPDKRTRLADVVPGLKKHFTLTRCAWDLPAPTLVVMGQAPNGLSGAIHPEHDRKFTIPELKRLFGLPDDFVLTGTLRQGAERICRMVPPLLTKALAESVYDRVLRPNAEAGE
jgi:DNA-cytosine methyltransferase